jgi:hypothetical protein
VRRLAFLLGIWLVSLAMASGRSVPSRKANNTKNRVSADYAAHWTATNTNTTNITTQTTNLTNLGTRLGGNTQQSYLGTVTQAAVPGTQAHTGVGTISGSGASNNITNAEFNSVNTTVNDMADLLNALIGRLTAGNILA